MNPQDLGIEQLVPGRLETTDDTAVFGSVLMSRVASNLPVLIRVRGLPGWATYVLTEPDCSIYCGGVRCGPEHCLVSNAGADLVLICRTPALVTLCRIGAKQSAPTTFQRAACRLIGSEAELSRIRGIVASMSQATPLQRPSFAELRDSLASLAVAAGTCESASRNHRAMAIERARRYIHTNLVGALRIANVCTAAGIRSRTLEYGFREWFGVSPVSYIKALRLNHVRRLLIAPASAGRTITTIALDSGFCHLSQFAADYHKFFGESPSITRRRSLPQEPAPLREARSAIGF